MTDDLLNEARERADQPSDGGWGYRQTLDEETSFLGRWRGQDTTDGMNGPQPVYLLWDADGAECFMYGSHKRLVREIERVQPDIGYDVAIVRGKDEFSNGRVAFSYGVSARPNMDALPVPPADPSESW